MAKEKPLVRLSTEAVRLLGRMRRLRLLIRHEMASDEEWEEFARLHMRAVADFLPVLESLAGTGLLTAHFSDSEFLGDKFESVGMEVMEAFENGNICLDANEFAECTMKRQAPQAPQAPQPPPEPSKN